MQLANRTGTTSLRAALEELLGAPCYHMYVMLASEGSTDVDFWNSALNRKVTTQVRSY